MAPSPSCAPPSPLSRMHSCAARCAAIRTTWVHLGTSMWVQSGTGVSKIDPCVVIFLANFKKENVCSRMMMSPITGCMRSEGIFLRAGGGEGAGRCVPKLRPQDAPRHLRSSIKKARAAPPYTPRACHPPEAGCVQKVFSYRLWSRRAEGDDLAGAARTVWLDR